MDNSKGQTDSCGNKPTSARVRIDPLQLLKCLSILLNNKGGIKSMGEVHRVAGLMGKYSRKLVSKCIYLNILQATQALLLDEFYREKGWSLVSSWLNDAITASNWPLCQQILCLLHTSPVTIERLKENNLPKMVKDLSVECEHEGARLLAVQVVQHWKEIVKGGELLPITEPKKTVDQFVIPAAPETEVTTPRRSSGRRGGGSAARRGRGGSTRGRKRSSPAKKRKSVVMVDDAEEEEEEEEVDDVPAKGATTSPIKSGAPIRITIRSGSQVLAKVSSEPMEDRAVVKHDQDASSKDVRGVPTHRLSLDSTDSEDNKPLSIIQKECQDKVDSEDGAAEGSSVPAGDSDQAPAESQFVEPEPLSAEVKSSENAYAALLNADAMAELTEESNNKETDETNGQRPLDSSTDETDAQVKPEENAEAEQVVVPSDEDTPTPTRRRVKASSKVLRSASKKKPPMRTLRKRLSRVKVIDSSSDEDSEAAATLEGLENENQSNIQKPVKEDESSNASVKEVKELSDEETDPQKVDRSPAEGKDKMEKKIKEEKKEREREHKKKDKDREHKERKNSRDGDQAEKKHRDGANQVEPNRDRERHRSGHDKDEKKSSSDSHSKSRDRRRDDERERRRERERELKKEQAEKDRATLEKTKPLSTDGLAKIPRRSSAPVSFLDALGSADSEASRKISVKSKSKGFRNMGLLDEPSKPPGVAGRRLDGKTPVVPSSKRPSSGSDGMALPVEKKIRPISSYPSSGDRPGGVKLISPKRPALSDDGGFMAALTAAGVDSRKRVTRKRRSSETESPKTADEAKGEERSKEDGRLSPTKGTEQAKNVNDPALSPTSVKPTFNFYKETLKGDDEDRDDAASSDDRKESSESVENSSEAKDEDQEENKMDTDDSDENGVLQESKIPLVPAVPAPAQEEYEKIEVMFSKPSKVLKSVLVYHRPPDRKKKAVKWREEDKLQHVFYFPLDEAERVNVSNPAKFHDMMVLDKQKEREMLRSQGAFGRGNLLGDRPGIFPDTSEEFMPWKLYPVHLPNPPKTVPGIKSQEKQIQAQREHSTIAAFFHPSILPDSPAEPDPEIVQRSEAKIIPLLDSENGDTVYDHCEKPWPEPVFPPPSYGFMGNMGPGPMGPANMPQPTPGGHWVMGNHPNTRFPGGPVFPGGPGQHPGPGNQGNFVGQPFPDMGPGPRWRGPNDFSGPPMMMPAGPPMMGGGGGGPLMGGPGGGPSMMGGGGPSMMGGGGSNMLGGGGPNMMGPPTCPGMGGPNMMPGMGGGGGGPGMRMNMKMGGSGPVRGRGGGNSGGGNPYKRGGGDGGGWNPNRRPRPPCSYFLNGFCKNGDSCRFAHVQT